MESADITLGCSHHIIKHKNAYKAKLLAFLELLEASSQLKEEEMELPPNCKWHFFLRSVVECAPVVAPKGAF